MVWGALDTWLIASAPTSIVARHVHHSPFFKVVRMGLMVLLETFVSEVLLINSI
jgi:hypothetical protein